MSRARPRAIVAILAGGAGTRMHAGGRMDAGRRTKASVPLAGRPLIAYPLLAGLAAGLEVVVTAKPSTALPDLPVALAFQVLREPEQPRHPLCGVLRALSYAQERSPAPAVVTVGCDMPLVSAGLLAYLADREGGALVVQAGGRRQPLLARYPATCAAAIARSLEREAPLAAALDELSPYVVGERELAAFGDPSVMCSNVNEPADLLVAARRLAAGGT